MRKLSTVLASLFFVSSALAAQPAQKDWTVLVYLNGNNNLDSFGAININQMEQVGSTDNVNVVVQWASTGAKTTKRVYVTKDNDTNTVSSPIIADIGNVDMGNYKTLEDFIHWGVKNYPAKHYFIDIWDHGSGWHNLQARFAGQPFHTQDISWDENTGSYITTEQLGQVMADAAQAIGHKVDIYGSDACLMAMAEVANEMADSVGIFVGSQETEPGAGWPYGDWLARWANTPNAAATDIASALVETYVKSYQGGSNGQGEVTFSAFDMSKLSLLDAAIANFSKKVQSLDATGKAALLKAAQGVQVFYDDDYADLVDFMKQISAKNVRGIDTQDVADVTSAAKQFVIANADTQQYARANGLSIWLPTRSSQYSENAQRYKAMRFNAATDWGSALDFLLQGASQTLN